MSRRIALGGALSALAISPALAKSARATPDLSQMIRHPLLRRLYGQGVSSQYDPSGAAERNRNGFKLIEDQRQGTEWIIHGLVSQKAEWVGLGWTLLDWGLTHQQPDGHFDSLDQFHSTGLFLEALARACILDPQGATPKRIDGLRRGLAWQMSPEVEAAGMASNGPYTHRRYILAAAYGQAAILTREERFKEKALWWAHAGLKLQRPDGVNPEKGGFDANYQGIGTLHALRYLPNCTDLLVLLPLKAMIRRALDLELSRQRPDGSIDATGSTRVGQEHLTNGELKTVSYPELYQALVYAGQVLPAPQFFTAAERIGGSRNWLPE